MFFVARLSFSDRRPDHLFKKIIHFSRIEPAFLFNHLARQLGACHRTEYLILHVFRFDGISFPEHADLRRHSKTMSLAEFDQRHFMDGHTPELIKARFICRLYGLLTFQSAEQVVNGLEYFCIHLKLYPHRGNFCRFT